MSSPLERLRRRLPAFLALTDQGVTSIAAFVAGILVARATSAGAFGIYTLVSVALTWANGAQSALVTTPYIYLQGRCAPGLRRLYSGSVLLHHWSLCALVAFVVAPLVAVALAWPAPSALILPIGIAAVGVLVKEYLRVTYYAHGEFGRALVVNCGIVVMQLGGMIALRATGRLSISNALIAMGLPTLLVAIPLQIARARQSQFDLRDSVRQLGASWSFGKWLVADPVISALSRDAYPWVLASLYGVEATGRYAVHLNMALLVNPAIMGVSNYIAPSFARTMQQQGPAALLGRVRLTAILMGAAMLFYSFLLLLGGGALSAAIYGERLRASSAVVALIALGLTVRAFSTPYGIALFALGRTDITIKAAAVALAVSLVVGIPAMIKLGIPGAAFAYVVSTLVEHVIKWTVLRRLPVATALLASQ